MTLSTTTRRLYQLFAEILDYPTNGLSAAIAECRTQLADTCPEAVAEMDRFATFVATESPGRLEELYTRTFDVTPTTTLYVGYHLFGESYKRGAFLAALQEAFAQHGFAPGAELADHLCVLLRFASTVHDPDFVAPLLDEAILPALDKVTEAFKGSRDGYAAVVRALHMVFGGPRARGQGPSVEGEYVPTSPSLRPSCGDLGSWRDDPNTPNSDPCPWTPDPGPLAPGPWPSSHAPCPLTLDPAPTVDPTPRRFPL